MKPSPIYLIVDDDPVFRLRLQRALTDRGLRAFAAENSDEALTIARNQPLGRAILDLRLGQENGLQLMSQLLEINPTLEVVILTGFGTISTAVSATRKGACNYLTKPTHADAILAAFADHPDLGEVKGDEGSTPSLDQVEWEHIQRVLADCDQNISEAARRLKMHRRSLQRKLLKQPPRG